jgi:N-acetylglutamate synthase-like GNAT family acetyltransferase
MSENKSNEVDFDKLQFMRVFTPMHVPKYLIEQIKDKTFEVEEWYSYQEKICTVVQNGNIQLNPMSSLYVISDEKYKVVGMLWCEIDPLEKSLVVQTFSMDKAYWCRGKAVELLAKKAKEIAKECNLKNIYWHTSYPKHSEWYGFKRSKQVLMEYKESEDGIGHERGSETHRQCAAPDRSTTESTK